MECNECHQLLMTIRDLENLESSHDRLNTKQLNKAQLKYAKFCSDTRLHNSFQENKMITYTANNDFDQTIEQGYAISSEKTCDSLLNKRIILTIYLNKVKLTN